MRRRSGRARAAPRRPARAGTASAGRGGGRPSGRRTSSRSRARRARSRSCSPTRSSRRRRTAPSAARRRSPRRASSCRRRRRAARAAGAGAPAARRAPPACSVLVEAEIGLAGPADRAEPVGGDLLERRSRRDAAVGIAFSRVVDEPAGLADPLLGCTRRSHALIVGSPAHGGRQTRPWRGAQHRGRDDAPRGGHGDRAARRRRRARGAARQAQPGAEVHGRRLGVPRRRGRRGRGPAAWRACARWPRRRRWRCPTPRRWSSSRAGSRPREVKIRFDTRFYLVAAPDGRGAAGPTAARCVDIGWFSPAGALEAYEREEILLVFPTIKTLEQLAAVRVRRASCWGGRRAARSCRSSRAWSSRARSRASCCRASRGTRHERRRRTAPASTPAARSEGAAVARRVVLAANYHGIGYAREEGTPTWEALEAAIGRAGGRQRGRVLLRHGGDRAMLEHAARSARASSGPQSATPACACCWPSAPRRAGSSSRRSTSPTPTAMLARVRGRRAAVGRDADEPADRRRRARPPVRGRPRRRRRGRRRRHLRDAAAAAPARARRRRRHAQRDEVHRRPLRPAARRRHRARPRSAPTRLRHTRGLLGATRARSRRSSRCAACARWRCASTARRRRAACSPSGSPPTRRSARSTTPASPGDPGHDRAARLLDGFGAMLAFEVAGGAEAAQAVARARPRDHPRHEPRRRRDADRAPRALRGEATPEALLRLSVGIEHVEDLWADPRPRSGR